LNEDEIRDFEAEIMQWVKKSNEQHRLIFPDVKYA